MDLGCMDRRLQHFDHAILDVANRAHEVVNDDKKFVVDLDVSRFKPEDLKVHIEGRDLTIEGIFSEIFSVNNEFRSFVRKWALPDDCDLDAVHTQLNESGHLQIEAPKTGQHTNRRTLPIMPAPKKKE
ncbi:unnamed protein product [Heligmosomoides polygyrus]|uniref:SHSP domain-containing protein n=1 Tax=Heligmosomoides polygyrus TaxID=6339 RepID=A0A183FTE7_HELPZ|nr:unnamed protein product [Heligmosomoides polygyrus]